MTPELIAAARRGHLGAIDALTRAMPAKEIRLKVVTHVGSWRGEARFDTWVFQIARNVAAAASLVAVSTRAM